MSRSEKSDFPAVGFYYEVSINGSDGTAAAFQEVSGIEVKSEVETISEAGLNEYSHRVPKRTSYDNLILKRGLYTEGSELKQWVIDTLEGGLLQFVRPKDIKITLMDEKCQKI